jgi:hypothetical protein
MAWESKERRSLVTIVGTQDGIVQTDKEGRALVEVDGVFKPLKVKAIGGVFYVRKGNTGLQPVQAVKYETVFGGVVEKVNYSLFV